MVYAVEMARYVLLDSRLAENLSWYLFLILNIEEEFYIDFFG